MKLYDRRSVGRTKSVPSVLEHVRVRKHTTDLSRMSFH